MPTTPGADASGPHDDADRHRSRHRRRPPDPGQTTASSSAAAGDATDDPLVEAWRNRVREVAADHDVLMLPYGDPDLAALAHADESRDRPAL